MKQFFTLTKDFIVMKKLIVLILALSSAYSFGLTKEEATAHAMARIEKLNTLIDQNPIEYFNGFDLFLDPITFISDKKNIDFIYYQSFFCFQLIDWTIIKNCLQNPELTIADAQEEIIQFHKNTDRIKAFKKEADQLTSCTLDSIYAMTTSDEISSYLWENMRTPKNDCDDFLEEMSQHIDLDTASYLDIFTNKNLINTLINNSLMVFQNTNSGIINSCILDSDLSLNKSIDILNAVDFIFAVVMDGKQQSDILTQEILKDIQ